MKLRKFIPDCITAMNIVCGVVGLVFAFEGKPTLAFPMMIAAAVFDFCDGLAARALDAYSDLGKELDSLCDLVSFGVLPAVMLYRSAYDFSAGQYPVYRLALAIAVFSALRLAKFNVDPRQHSSFLGLPPPACALLVASLCHYAACEPGSFVALWLSGPVFPVVLTVCLCALLVCEIPMFSMKFSFGAHQGIDVTGWKRIAFVAFVLVFVVLAVVLHLTWSAVVAAAFALYIVKNVIYWIFKV